MTKKKIMALLIVPLSFLILGYSLVYLAAKPVVDSALAMAGMFIGSQVPDFAGDLESIYEDQDFLALDEIPLKDVSIPSVNTHYGRLVNENAGLDASVYFGDNPRVLRVGAGQYTGSFLPGFGGTILISGHNTTVFAPLEFIQEGDEITFTTHYAKYVYRVRDIEIRDFRDPLAFDLTQDREELVLYTCYSFEQLSGRKTDRIFVYCDKIKGPTVAKEGP